MKTIWIPILTLILSGQSYAQSIESIIKIANKNGGALRATASNNSNYFLGFSSSDSIAIGTESYSALNGSALLVGRNSNDVTIWTKTISTSSNEIYLTDATFDSMGCVIVIGHCDTQPYYIENIEIDSRGFICKINSTGEILWVHEIANLYPIAIANNSADDLFIVGHFSDTLIYAGIQTICQSIGAFQFPWDFALLKLTSVAQEEWIRTYGIEYTDTAVDIEIDSDDAIICTGNFELGPISFSNEEVNAGPFIFKFDSEGNEIWAKSFSQIVSNTFDGAWVKAIDTESEGNVYALISFDSDSLYTELGPIVGMDCDPLVPDDMHLMVKYSPIGEMLNYLSISCHNTERFDWTMLVSDNKLYLGGTFNTSMSVGNELFLTNSNNAQNGFITELDLNLNPQWVLQTTEQLNGDGVYMHEMFVLNNKLNVSGLFEQHMSIGNFDISADDLSDRFLLRIDTNTSSEGLLLDNMAIYPNPASSLITLRSLPEDVIEIKIYNNTGQLIQCTTPQKQINVNSLASGVYCLAIIANGIVYSSRFVKE